MVFINGDWYCSKIVSTGYKCTSTYLWMSTSIYLYMGEFYRNRSSRAFYFVSVAMQLLNTKICKSKRPKLNIIISIQAKDFWIFCYHFHDLKFKAYSEKGSWTTIANLLLLVLAAFHVLIDISDIHACKQPAQHDYAFL